jgi:hypothetical protein
MGSLEDDRREIIKRLEIGRGELLTEIGTLEEEVGRLEAEDLQPLVDRLRDKIHRILGLVEEMATETEKSEGT